MKSLRCRFVEIAVGSFGLSYSIEESSITFIRDSRVHLLSRFSLCEKWNVQFLRCHINELGSIGGEGVLKSVTYKLNFFLKKDLICVILFPGVLLCF